MSLIPRTVLFARASTVFLRSPRVPLRSHFHTCSFLFNSKPDANSTSSSFKQVRARPQDPQPTPEDLEAQKKQRQDESKRAAAKKRTSILILLVTLAAGTTLVRKFFKEEKRKSHDLLSVQVRALSAFYSPASLSLFILMMCFFIVN